jgi:hypothetical protein
MQDTSLAGVNMCIKSDQKGRVIHDYGGKMLHPIATSTTDWNTLMKLHFLWSKNSFMIFDKIFGMFILVYW